MMVQRFGILSFACAILLPRFAEKKLFFPQIAENHQKLLTFVVNDA
jgi:hypothetical protein